MEYLPTFTIHGAFGIHEFDAPGQVFSSKRQVERRLVSLEVVLGQGSVGSDSLNKSTAWGSLEFRGTFPKKTLVRYVCFQK